MAKKKKAKTKTKNIKFLALSILENNRETKYKF